MTASIDSKNEEAARRVARRRSIAIALTLGAMVLLFYAATIVRLGGNVAKVAM
jgi:cell division septal protein FtsQ